jgi:hypothetical protein
LKAKEKLMRAEGRILYLVAVVVGWLWFLPQAASAQDRGFNVDPFHFGLGGLATWERDAGEPDQTGRSNQHGLYLQKHTATANFAAAGAEITGITPLAASELNTLAFDISGFPGVTTFNVANGYCGAGAPRFNVVSTGSGTCFLGCAHGNKTQDPVTGWWEIKFVAPFTQFPGCPGVTGTVTSIAIIFDEGNDVAVPPPSVGLSPGDVVLDNIRVNANVVGEPNGRTTIRR